MCKECVSPSSSSTARAQHTLLLYSVKRMYVSRRTRCRRGRSSVGGRPGVPSIHYLRRNPPAACRRVVAVHERCRYSSSAHSTRVPVRALNLSLSFTAAAGVARCLLRPPPRRSVRAGSRRISRPRFRAGPCRRP